MPPKVQRATRATVQGPGGRAATPALNSMFGLSADFPELVEIDVGAIRPNPDQPRTVFDDASLRGLADSIAAHGLQQPILVKRAGAGAYTLVAGERRLRAHQLLGRPTIFAIVSAGNAEELALVENVQRVDLDAVDLARGLERLVERHGYTQETVGALVGCDRAEVARTLAVLRLPDDILLEYRQHTRTVSRTTLAELAQVGDPGIQRRLWEQAKQGLTVRELREQKRAAKSPSPSQSGHTLREVGKSLLRIGKDVASLRQHADALGREHRDRLRELRDEIDRLLGGS